MTRPTEKNGWEHRFGVMAGEVLLLNICAIFTATTASRESLAVSVKKERVSYNFLNMATRTKIKIVDNSELRAEIDYLYEQNNQIDLAKWAINCAKHILTLADNEEFDKKAIENGFRINELWQIGNATVHEVRQAGFKIHEVARQCESEITKNAIRTCGQAVGVGHMREHAMVCSDYAIKTIQLASPDQMDKILQERQWQLNELKKYK